MSLNINSREFTYSNRYLECVFEYYILKTVFIKHNSYLSWCLNQSLRSRFSVFFFFEVRLTKGRLYSCSVETIIVQTRRFRLEILREHAFWRLFAIRVVYFLFSTGARIINYNYRVICKKFDWICWEYLFSPGSTVLSLNRCSRGYEVVDHEQNFRDNFIEIVNRIFSRLQTTLALRWTCTCESVTCGTYSNIYIYIHECVYIWITLHDILRRQLITVAGIRTRRHRRPRAVFRTAAQEPLTFRPTLLGYYCIIVIY